MKTRRTALVLVLAGLLIVAWAWPAVAQAPAASSSEAQPAEVSPAPRSDAAEPVATEESPDKLEVLARIMDQAGKYLVTVSTKWQKDQGETPDGDFESRSFQTRVMGYPAYVPVVAQIERKMSTETLGMMLDPARGLIVAPDPKVEPRFVETIRAILADGRECPLTLHGFLMNADLVLYRAEAWPGAAVPLEWANGEADLLEDALQGAGLERNRQGWQITVAGGRGEQLGRVVGEDTLQSGSQWMRRPKLVFDGDGRPLGFACGRISLTDDRYPWRGPDLMKQQVVTLAEFDRLKSETLDRCGKFAHEVKIVYRQPEENERNLEFEGEDRTSLTQYYYGYAISSTRIFVPVKLEKIYIQRFKSISVDLEGREAPARFVGAYLDFGGFVVELEDATSSGVLPLEAAPLPDFERAVLTYLPERRFGKRRNVVWYNRAADFDRGYNDRLWPRLSNAAARGTLVMDFQGRPIGLCLIERRPEEEKKAEQDRWSLRALGDELQLFLISDLADAFRNPEAHFDPNLKPTTQQEEKRLVWLGVEFQPVGPLLAEMLDDMQGSEQVRKLTRNGEVGLRVTYVHENSPASKAGIAVGDILLEVQEEGKDKPIELKPLGDFGSYRMRYDLGRGMRSYRSSAAFGARNYLTQLLTRIGPGGKVTLSWLRGEEKQSREFVLEWGPYDFESAPKFKDEKTGLTVKDLTYDVRAVLRLSAEQPGVIVSKVEEGQKADIAQIGPRQIITEINGEPIRNVEHYERKMTAIQDAEGGGTAVMTILWLGKSNIVRIQFP